MLDDTIGEAMFGDGHGFLQVELHYSGGGGSSGLLGFCLFFLFFGPQLFGWAFVSLGFGQRFSPFWFVFCLWACCL